MTVLRVIGVGSPSGDDQAGWLVVDALRRAGRIERMPCSASIVALDRPGAQLLQHLEGADIIVLIDAMRSGAPPGTLHRLDGLARIKGDLLVSCHGFGVASALALAHAMGALPPTVLLYGIEIDPAAMSGDPSDLVRAAAEELAQLIAGQLAQRARGQPASAAAT